MGNDTFVLSSLPAEKSSLFLNMDPTVMLRLHSILSNKDIFILKGLYDYSVKIETDGTVSMKLPSDMLESLGNLNIHEQVHATKRWMESKEVRLNSWTFCQCKENFLKLLRFAKLGRNKIKMSLNYSAGRAC